jgi:hypothetical protein
VCVYGDLKGRKKEKTFYQDHMKLTGKKMVNNLMQAQKKREKEKDF